ncbi:enoyl-CoA hydratase/isomerase family protein [Arthrobacter sp. OV608]|uniref:enoyl-CoA hydratase/isomerase family protein n=1 Tax=Arthrobacter sp. OV608 TaxID=1882768 RepID=UPI0008C69715|nr:enoyl-CoA hydratase/isomerase family protein [Arthrobacter sp. OV608]SEQ25792.1 Enoyl-CoA hydratase/carnithine racemase [Arthrobacter sp. OV608]
MTEFVDYQHSYRHIKLTRGEDGILLVQLHSDNDFLRMGETTHRDLTAAFRQIALDRANRVVIITGTGTDFIGPRADAPGGRTLTRQSNLADEYAVWEELAWTNQREMNNALLDIPVPVIAAVNGPVRRHCELPLYSDIVLASETASFEDSAHFDLQDLVPGDGSHIWMTMLLGINRARAYMLTGEVITAEEALRWGLVKEVLPQQRVLERAWELARRIAEKSDSTLRFTRSLMVQPIKKQTLELQGMGLAYEALAAFGRGL